MKLFYEYLLHGKIGEFQLGESVDALVAAFGPAFIDSIKSRKYTTCVYRYDIFDFYIDDSDRSNPIVEDLFIYFDYLDEPYNKTIPDILRPDDWCPDHKTLPEEFARYLESNGLNWSMNQKLTDICEGDEEHYDIGLSRATFTINKEYWADDECHRVLDPGLYLVHIRKPDLQE